MTTDELRACLAAGLELFQGLPLTCALLSAMAKDLDGGNPAWAGPVLKAWESRVFASPRDACRLLLTAVHFEALAQPKSVLASHLPSCGGEPRAGLELALKALLEAPSAAWSENLSARSRQTHGEPLSSLWMSPAFDFFQRRELPYCLIEAGSAGGLPVIADLLEPRPGFDSELIEARLGINRPLLRLERAEDRLWLQAGTLPEHAPALARLERSIDRFLDMTRKTPQLVQLAECAAAQAPQFIAKNIQPEPESGLLVFTSMLGSRMDPAEKDRFALELSNVLNAWGHRSLWVELETTGVSPFQASFEVFGYRQVAGQWTHARLLQLELGATVALKVDEAGTAFLRA